MSNPHQIPLAEQVEVPNATESSQATTPTNINTLPNELLLNIFSHLDTPKPSSTDALLYNEPSFNITQSDVANLKTVSYISKRWRAAVSHLLFKHTRLIIPRANGNAKDGNDFQAEIKLFFDFVIRNGLRKIITSFVLVCYERRLEDNRKRDPNNVLSVFWEALFEVIDPVDLLIVAPAEALAFFTACEVNDEESWNFDCPCQFLRLQRSPDSPNINNEKVINQGGKPILASNFQGFPSLSGGGGIVNAPTSTNRAVLLLDHPWSKMLLNEGSFIKAYSTYEFWERSPPSILSDLLGGTHVGPALIIPALISPTIRDLEYVGIFPMESHFTHITRHLPRLDRLYVQLVPRNNILDDKLKMKRVDAADLWAERNRCYADLMRELFNTPAEGNYMYLKTFESGDAADREAWNMAVEFVRRANVGWRVAEEGVFVRDLPSAQADDGEGSAFENSLIRWAWNGTVKLPVPSTPLYFGMVF